MSIQNSRQVGDVKVMLKTGVDGNGIASIEKTGTSGLVDTYTITFTSGSKTTFTVTNGKGISSIAKTGTSGLVDTYTITFNDGTTSTFTVTNGNGISNIAKTSTSGLVDTYTITYTDGTTSTFQVTNGADTNAQIAERVSNPAQRAYTVGEYIILSDTLYKVTAPIASGANFVVNTNITATEVMDEVNDRMTYADNARTGVHNFAELNMPNRTDNGITYDVDKVATVIGIKGTATANSSLASGEDFTQNSFLLKKGNYKVSGGKSSAKTLGVLSNAGGSLSRLCTDAGSGASFSLASDAYVMIQINISSGQVITGTEYFYPMIKLANDTCTEHTPLAMSNIDLTNKKLSYEEYIKTGVHNILPDKVKTETIGTFTIVDNQGELTVDGSVSTTTDRYYVGEGTTGWEYTSWPTGYYIISCDNTTGLPADFRLLVIEEGGGIIASCYSSYPSVKFKIDASKRYRILIRFGAGSYSNVTLHPMIRPASDPITDWAKPAMTNFELSNPTFTEASTRANIASGESLRTILGKIKKFFSDILWPSVYSGTETVVGKWIDGRDIYAVTKKCTISATSGSTIYFTDFNNLFGGKELAWLQDGFICEDTDPSTPSVYAWKYPLFDNDYVDKWYCTNGLACTAKKTFNNIDFYLTVNYIKNPT